jgi:signal transduction histidine kinase
VRLEGEVADRTRELSERNQQLEAAKTVAEAATKTKAEFLSNMSHEIRTPMNAVVGLSRLLSATDLSLEQQQYVSMITSSSHVLLHIVNDILDYSRIEAGQTRITPIVHNLIDTIETAAMLVYGLAQAKHLQIAWLVENIDLPSKLLVDAPRLQQILINLLSNGPSWKCGASTRYADDTFLSHQSALSAYLLVAQR